MEHEENSHELNTKEREHLKKRITTSIFKYRRQKKAISYVAGIASVAVVAFFSFGVYLDNSQNPSIEAFVESSTTTIDPKSDKVTLVFEEGKSINIDGDNSNIAYSSSGEKVTIGKNDQLKQSSKKNNEVVYNTLIVPYGKRSTVQLSDGTTVWLNSGSKLVYPVTFNQNKREVFLEGEGIFDVAHNKKQPFLVLSKDHEIEVLGTVFNISSYSDDNTVSTTLKSGSVQIKYKVDSFFKSQEVLKITPGTQSVYGKNSNTIYSKSVDVEKYFSWKDGVFIFKNDNLKHIMKRLSRYYNVDISVDNKELENQTFSGYLDLKENVENVISIIKETSDFEYTTNDNQILIN
nr:FecR domain-containing protein [uncultured Allomuricauda sp.]